MVDIVTVLCKANDPSKPKALYTTLPHPEEFAAKVRLINEKIVIGLNY